MITWSQWWQHYSHAVTQQNVEQVIGGHELSQDRPQLDRCIVDTLCLLTPHCRRLVELMYESYVRLDATVTGAGSQMAGFVPLVMCISVEYVSCIFCFLTTLFVLFMRLVCAIYNWTRGIFTGFKLDTWRTIAKKSHPKIKLFFFTSQSSSRSLVVGLRSVCPSVDFCEKMTFRVSKV